MVQARTKDIVTFNFCLFVEYKEYKNKVNDFYRTSNSENIKTCNNIFPTDAEGRLNIIKHFKLIKKYFNHYKNNETHNSNKWCSYINFWLNNELKNEDNKLGSKIFDLYQKFINCDNEIKGITKCESSDIYYFEENTFDQVKKMYDLYDDYIYVDAFKTNTDNSIPCSYAREFTEKFNNIIETGVHKNNDHLYNALQDIKHLFEKIGLASLKTCEPSIPELLPITKGQADESTQSRTPSHSFNLTPILPSTVGIVLFSFFTYKFTPLGPFLRYRVMNKKNTLNELEEKSKYLYMMSENKGILPENSMFNMQYHTLQNHKLE
ncbi:variable surface protein Vir6, putative [Plasmodium vivax]|uniref:Variable surface protein Vir6, putative n=1 Tax=Plasmodium vivax (strain Salvador I) TaxID=126793 RepID=A5KCQ8_PLAVS|nr:variable surface protein Vir6, putative [Plasmodium vivax]EDL42862.1 variable surface protein Vir6, putative [Plasmodium vivax]|eukprot:XP_001612636.1 variable surface protein Vir6 [Plasmodium vivax Sal-1]